MGLDFSELLDRASGSHWLSGLAGSLVALRGAPGATWKQRAFNVFSGLVCAGFGAPAITETFGLNTAGMTSAVGFGCGLFGMNLVAAITGWIAEAKLSDVIPWLRRGSRRRDK